MLNINLGVDLSAPAFKSVLLDNDFFFPACTTAAELVLMIRQDGNIHPEGFHMIWSYL